MNSPQGRTPSMTGVPAVAGPGVGALLLVPAAAGLESAALD
jgi:hypothetical protein